MGCSVKKSFAKYLFFSLALTLIACNQTRKLDQSETEVASQNFSAHDVNLYPMDKLVCSPFGDNSEPGDLKMGIKAELFYFNSYQPNYTTVKDFFKYANNSHRQIFFNQIFAPTRYFTRGFTSETGEMFKTNEGLPLVESFGLKFRTTLKLSSDQEEGEYEFALIADDGAILKYKNSNNQWVELVNNDGVHAARMGCSSNTVNMTRDTELEVELDYFQGPRYAIALVPIWRKANPNNVNKDPSCGLTGRQEFWDRDNNSKPTQGWLELESRGWTVISSKNFHLPHEADFNPCAHGEAPTISNFFVEVIRPGLVLLQWETDIEATSQVRIVDDSGLETLTVSDNVLTKLHQVILSNQPVNKTLYLQAVSISNSYGKSLSPVASIRMEE